jgi:hypothetical protein
VLTEQIHHFRELWKTVSKIAPRTRHKPPLYTMQHATVAVHFDLARKAFVLDYTIDLR